MSAKIKKKGNKSDYEKYPNLSFSPHKQQKVSRLKTADQNSDCNCINLQIKILLYRRQKHVTLWSWECDVFLSHLFIYLFILVINGSELANFHMNKTIFADVYNIKWPCIAGLILIQFYSIEDHATLTVVVPRSALRCKFLILLSHF